MGAVSWVKQRIASAWVGRVQRSANRHAEEVRELQSQTGRTRRLLIRFDAFESDVTKRGFIDQETYTYYVRIVDGRTEIATASDRWDGHVMTDVPTLVALQQGHFDKVVPNGGGGSRVVRLEPWTPRRAWFAGRICTDGDASMLSNLLLFERRVWSEMLDEIRSDESPAR